MTVTVKRARVGDAATPVADIGLWPRVNALIPQLDARGARHCGIACTSAAAFAVAVVALFATGRTAVLMATDGEADCVITDQPGAGAGAVVVPAAGTGGDATPRPLDDAAEVWFHTSGSSGTPGTVRKRCGQVREAIANITATFGSRIEPSMVVPSVPLDHSFGFLFGCMLPLLNDWPMHARQCTAPGMLRAVLGRHRATVISSPAFLGSLRELDMTLPAAGIEAIFSAGAPVLPDLAQWVHEHCGQAPIGIYGTTELGPIAWRQWLPDDRSMQWRVVERVQVAIRPDDQGERLHVLTGFGDGWTVADDYVRVTADGFELLGRVDSVVKVADKRVSLSSMCAALQRHPWVADARVVKLAGERARLGAVVVLTVIGQQTLSDQGRAAMVAGLRMALAGAYETVLIPRKWRFIERWPDDALGKVKHQFLLEVLERPA